MRIIILSDNWPPESQGGAAEVAAAAAQAVAAQGQEVLVVTTTRKRDEEGEVKEGETRVIRIYADYPERWRAWRSLYNPAMVRRVREIMKEFRPGVVHAHNIHYYLSYACLKVAKRYGARVFLTVHDVMSFAYGKLMTERYLRPAEKSVRNSFDYRVGFRDRWKQAGKRLNPGRELVIRHYLRFVDRIIAVSKALREALRQNGLGEAEVLHNGIRAEEWRVERREANYFRERQKLIGRKAVLFGGRLSEAKGLEQMRAAMKRVREAVPAAILLGFGNRGVMGAEGEKWLGWVDKGELKLAMAAAAVVVVPSVSFDSLPTVVLEAMASGRPVVATHYGGAREMVEEGRTGYVANPFNIEELAERIIELLKDEKKAEQFGRVGRERVEREFSLEKQAERLIKIYQGDF